MNFILSIAPNFGAALLCTFLMERAFTYHFIREYTLKLSALCILITFILAMLSEVVHHLFLSSLFDLNDIVATVVALLVYILTIAVVKKKQNIKDNHSI